MPVTFPSHAAAVLPLKWWKPRWFDGIALTVGSAAPDVAYALDGTWLEWPVRSLPPTWALAHSWVGVVVWGLPVTLALMFIHFGRLKSVAAAALPAVERRKEKLGLAGAAASWGIWWRGAGLNWVVVGVVIAAGAAVVPLLPGAGLAHTTGVRLLLVASVAVIAGRVTRRKER